MKATLLAKWGMKATLRAKSSITERLEGHIAGKVEFRGGKAILLTKWSMQGVILKQVMEVPGSNSKAHEIKARFERCCGSYEDGVGLVAGVKKGGCLWVV